jgi:hypothetical protein
MMDRARSRKAALPKASIAVAIAVAIGVLVSTPAISNPRGTTQGVTNHALEQNLSLSGPLLVGPIEYVAHSEGTISVLGTKVKLQTSTDQFLPAQYVAVFGSLSSNGRISAHSVATLDEVYAPGSSLVLYAGKASSRPFHVVSLGGVALDGLAIPGFEDWIESQRGALVVAVGTQALSGAPISLSAAVSFKGAGYLAIDGTGIQAIDGSGIQAIDGSGIQAIDGSGIQAIDGSGIQAIDGSGAH